MELIIEVTSDERHLLGDNAVKSFLTVGGVIGRHADCDWAIPDQKRHLSSRHALISFENGSFQLTDMSTNGVFLNGASHPIGRDCSVVLNNDDRLSMGNIEFLVRLQLDAAQHPFKSQTNLEVAPSNPFEKVGAATNSEGFIDPIELFKKANGVVEESRDTIPEEDNGSAPFIAPRSEVQTAFTPPNVLPEDWYAIPPNLEGKADTGSNSDQTTQAKSEPPPSLDAIQPVEQLPFEAQTQIFKAVKSKQSIPPQSTENSRDRLLLERFFKGLGVSPSILDKVDAANVMEEMGACLKANMEGMVGLMQQRSHLKNELRMDMTLVKTQGNNPLKFSVDSKQALKQLFRPEKNSFLPMRHAFSECYSDLQMHQVAVLSGSQLAVREMFKQLSPEKIERKVEEDRAGISMSSKPSRCWHKYRSYHQELSSEEDRYQSLFTDAFVTAYEEQMDVIKKSTKEEAS